MSEEYDLCAVGRCVLDLCTENSIANAESFRVSIGGTPANICVGASRLGLKTAIITALGDDESAQLLTRRLQNENIDTRYILYKKNYRTGLLLIGSKHDKPFVISYCRDSPDLALTKKDLEKSIISCKILLISGMALVQEPSRSAIHYAVTRAVSRGSKIAIDLDYRQHLWPDEANFRAAIKDILPFAQIIFATAQEMKIAGGKTKLWNGNIEILVEKQGADGAIWHGQDNKIIPVPAFPISVTNTMGTGDAFAATFLHGYLQQWPPAKIMERASAAGAIVAKKTTCAQAMPYENEIISFIKSYPKNNENVI